MSEKQPFKILLVDDDELVHLTAEEEYELYPDLKFISAYSGEDAILELKKGPHKYAVVLLDFQMGDGLDGAETAEKILEINPDQFIVICSGDDSRHAIKKTFKAGALDFLEKTLPTDEKVKILRDYCSKYRTYHEALTPTALSKKYREVLDKVEMVGKTKEIYKVAEKILLSAQYDSNVLIRGESGTGKELAARAIHANSDRKYKSFSAFNCGAIPSSLIESELFGHAKGAFTGAINEHKGRFMEADGGTVFLDEIGDMPFEIQVKILRFLQEGVIEPIGKRPLKVNVRIIAATHVNLEKQIQEGKFREDLFFRLNVLGIEIPPLRKRIDDIDMLLLHFAKKHFQDMKVFTPPAVEKLKRYDWPGNIRQLENAVQRLNIDAHNSNIIKSCHLGDEFFNSISIRKKGEATDMQGIATVYGN